MIESFTCHLNQENSSSYLRKTLIQNGISVKFRHDDEEMLGKISKPFSRLFIKFYNSYKLSGLSIKVLKKMFSDPKYRMFLAIFDRFLDHFEELVGRENRMGFTDLLIGAIDKLDDNKLRDFDYMIVDEFQDTSNIALKLFDKIYQNNPRMITFFVGDDWQSIYGFSGSDVTIISDYEKRYKGVSVKKLNSNFRSHPKIVELGKYFISKNSAQISKEVVSGNSNYMDSEIAFLPFTEMEERIEMIPDDESIFILYRYNADCPMDKGSFGKYFGRDKQGRPYKKSSCLKNISMMTIHGSKGLEARNVFILFPDGVRRKFPSDIEDHYVFNMLKNNSDDYPFSEERRLMYVAISRAEQNLYFVSPYESDPNSVFWDELKELVEDHHL